jgi:hypothetical protein
MRKLFLATIVASAGCAAQPSTSPAPVESTGTTGQALTAPAAAPGDDDGDTTSKLPKLRLVPPHGAGSSSTGTGGTSGTGNPSTGTWVPLTNFPTDWYAGTALQLTDGSVMIASLGTSVWERLIPDATGSYVNGTWKQTAPMPNGYAPLYFASAVLPDGRVIVMGGEYQYDPVNGYEPVWQTTGAIYDPTADRWVSVAPPAGWTTIGDAQSIVLADGRFLLADCCSTKSAILDPKTLTWTAFGSGKADVFDEEGWTLLPSGQLLTVDANNLADLSHVELFNPRTGVWSGAGDTPVQLPDTTATGGGTHELGPQLLRPDGTVWAVGATGHTAVYHTKGARWTAGPDFPFIAGQGQLDTADGPAVLEPSGNALVVASPGFNRTPSHVFEFDGTRMAEIAAPPNAVNDPSFVASFLVLPNGQILFTDFTNDIEIYTPAGRADCSWEPRIDDACELGELTQGNTYRLDGEQLNGLSQGAVYGDDAQAATNYPLVRITNEASGHVTYARTHDHSSMSVAHNVSSHTSFDVPATAEPGESRLEVVVNGIASRPVEVEVVAPCSK